MSLILSTHPIPVGKKLSLSTFYRGRNKSSERLSDLPKVNQLSNNGVRLEFRRFQPQTLAFQQVLSHLITLLLFAAKELLGGGWWVGQVRPHTGWVLRKGWLSEIPVKKVLLCKVGNTIRVVTYYWPDS